MIFFELIMHIINVKKLSYRFGCWNILSQKIRYFNFMKIKKNTKNLARRDLIYFHIYED